MSDICFHAGGLKLFQNSSCGPAPWLQAAVAPAGLQPVLESEGLSVAFRLLIQHYQWWHHTEGCVKIQTGSVARAWLERKRVSHSRCLFCGLITREQSTASWRNSVWSFSVSVWVVPGRPGVLQRDSTAFWTVLGSECTDGLTKKPWAYRCLGIWFPVRSVFGQLAQLRYKGLSCGEVGGPENSQITLSSYTESELCEWPWAGEWPCQACVPVLYSGEGLMSHDCCEAWEAGVCIALSGTPGPWWELCWCPLFGQAALALLTSTTRSGCSCRSQLQKSRAVQHRPVFPSSGPSSGFLLV